MSCWKVWKAHLDTAGSDLGWVKGCSSQFEVTTSKIASAQSWELTFMFLQPFGFQAAEGGPLWAVAQMPHYTDSIFFSTMKIFSWYN